MARSIATGSPSSSAATAPGRTRSPATSGASASCGLPARRPARTVKTPDAEFSRRRQVRVAIGVAAGAAVAMAPLVLSYGRQTIEEDDIAAVVDALRAPLLTCGPLVERFEAALASAVGATHATACSSGTAALHLAYAALGIGPGHDIITTPITFSATAAAAYYVGANVRIADVDPRTGNLDPKSVAALITDATRAIVPVHLAGQPADLDELAAI